MRHLRALPKAFGARAACLGALALLGCTHSAPADGDGGNAGMPMGGSTGGIGKGGSSGASGTPGSGGKTGSGGNAAGMMNAGGAGAGGAAGATGGAGTTSSGGSAGKGGRGGSAGSAGDGGTTSGGLAGMSGTGGAGGAGGAMGGSTGGGGASAGTGGAPSLCVPETPLTGGKQYCSNSKGDAGGNYAYELWAEGPGTGCMTVRGKDAAFAATWTGVDDFLARVGLDFDQTKTPEQLGTLSADFAHTKTGGEEGLVYVGIYGWTVSPLKEYYVLDDWGATKPAGTASDGTPRTAVGTFELDGGIYDVWKKLRENKPAITGDSETFEQYFSIRQTSRECGHISISGHFAKWKEMGLELGKLYEAKLLLEAQDSTGTIDFTTAKVVVQ